MKRLATKLKKILVNSGRVESNLQSRDRIQKILLNSEPCSVLFVCKGNICRSAYAEVAARKLAESLAIADIRFTSCGIYTNDGKSADPDAIRTAALREVDLAPHVTTLANRELLVASSLILCMESEHRKKVLKLLPGAESKSFLLTSLNGELGLSKVPDPYGKSDLEFKKCFDMIDSCLMPLIAILRQKNS